MRLRQTRRSKLFYIDDLAVNEGAAPVELPDRRQTPEEHHSLEETLALMKELARAPDGR